MEPATRHYGSWPSPVTTELLTTAGVGLSEVRVDGDDVYWHERRPSEDGRGVVVRHTTGAAPTDAIPRDADVRSRVHEYGGGAYAVASGTVYYVNDADDQRVHRVRPGEPSRAITPAPPAPRARRYADLEVHPSGALLVAVEEVHDGHGEPVNRLVALPTTGQGEPRGIAGGHDFFAAPRVSPDGRTLAWITWEHPHMPWDASALWTATLAPDGTLSNERRVAGPGDAGRPESLTHPFWTADGTLHVVSDRTGYWNVYAVRAGELHALAPIQAELAHPHWVFGMSTLAPLSDGRLACAYRAKDAWHVGIVARGRIDELQLPYTSLTRAPSLVADAQDRILFVGASPTRAPEIVRVTLGGGEPVCEVLHRSAETTIDDAYVSVPEAIEFPTAGGRTSHAFFYPPHHPRVRAPEGERPPLIVIVHGGPTSSTSVSLALDVQFWTTRGIAVVDVDYGGSSGYGREYRDRLRRGWGVVDVADCVAAARHLAREGRVDGDRLAMKGGSAGGYTTLAALAFHDVFSAGSSWFGVADLELLATETHKFESRYLDGLVGPYPETRARYRERSPIHAADRIDCPLLILQGNEDRVVPPDQAERLVAALEARKRPYAYILFEGEGHGFRKSETIARAANAELAFFGRVFGFTPAGEVPPLDVRNLTA